MSEPREGRWLAKPLKPRLRPIEIQPWLSGLWLLAIAYAELGRWPDKIVRLVGCVVVGVLVIGAMATMPLLELGRLRRTKRDRALADRPEGVEEHPVEIVVWANRKKIGADRGLAYFDDELLGFSGERTSFLVAADDLDYPRGPMLSDFDLPFRALKPKIAGGKARVEIRPLLGHGRRYRKRMRVFLRAGESSDAERQWPPLVPYASPPSTPSSSTDGKEEGASLRDRLEHAVAFQDDVDHGALHVRELDQG